MDLIIEGFYQAFALMIRGDLEVWWVVARSLGVSGAATVLALCVGVPLGAALGLSRFRGRSVITSLVNTGMGSPPVVVGLIVTIFLWRNGPLGVLHLLYTPAAMVVAQFIISLPIVTGFTMAAVQQLDPKLRLQLLALGASRPQMVWLLLREARLPLLAAVMAGFGAVISEVGASMMVGGNIQGETEVLTTAMVTQTGKGEFGLAIAFGIILMVMVYLVNLALTIIQQRSKPR